MNRTVKALMNRDGLTEEDAREFYEDEMKYVMELIGEGDFQGAEDAFSDVFGLEPDFLLDALI